MGSFFVGVRRRGVQGRIAAATAVLGVVTASAGMIVSTAGAASAANDKPVICHTTGSESNPSVSISPSEKAKGHQKHDGEGAETEVCAPGADTPVTQDPKGCEQSAAAPQKCDSTAPSAPVDNHTDTGTDTGDTDLDAGGDTKTGTDTGTDDRAGDETTGDQPVGNDVGSDPTPVKPGKQPGAHAGGKHPSAGKPIVLGAEKIAAPKKGTHTVKRPSAQAGSIAAPATGQIAPRAVVPTVVSAGLGGTSQLTGVSGSDASALGGRLLGGGLLMLFGAAALGFGSRPSRRPVS